MSETKDKKYKDLSNAIERLLDAAAQCEIPIVEIQFSNVQSQNVNDTLLAVRESQHEGRIVSEKTDEEPMQHVVACLQTGYS